MLEHQLVSAVQTRLADLGDYRLRIDGLSGPGTSAAIVAFKARHGLRARDNVGPLTMAAMFAPTAKPAPEAVPRGDDPAWLTAARGLINTRETPGAANNPEIMRWARDLDQWYPGDDVPWCGLFIAHCMNVGAPDEPQDFNRLGARAWGGYGEDAGGPQLGAICTLWRTHPTRSWNGHVLIITGQSADAIRGIGGNQGDAVSEAWFSRARVLTFRQPTGAVLVPAPTARTGELSTNEA